MDEIYVYVVPLPDGIHEMVTPCLEGYTIYINEKLDDSRRMASYYHAMRHIKGDDFGKSDVQMIESEAHK